MFNFEVRLFSQKCKKVKRINNGRVYVTFMLDFYLLCVSIEIKRLKRH